MDDAKFYSPKEVSNMLPCLGSENMIRKLCRKKKLKGVKFGPGKKASWKISNHAIKEYVKNIGIYETLWNTLRKKGII